MKRIQRGHCFRFALLALLVVLMSLCLHARQVHSDVKCVRTATRSLLLLVNDQEQMFNQL